MTAQQRRRLARNAGRIGGAARAQALPPSRRTEIARLAATTRWERQRVKQELVATLRAAGLRQGWHPQPCPCSLCVALAAAWETESSSAHPPRSTSQPGPGGPLVPGVQPSW